MSLQGISPQRRYTYDANGNLAGIDDSRKGNRSYHYDPLDRLINVRGATPESFVHGPAGNLLGQGEQPTANLANVKGNRLHLLGCVLLVRQRGEHDEQRTGGT